MKPNLWQAMYALGIPPSGVTLNIEGKDHKFMIPNLLLMSSCYFSVTDPNYGPHAIPLPFAIISTIIPPSASDIPDWPTKFNPPLEGRIKLDGVPWWAADAKRVNDLGCLSQSVVIFAMVASFAVAAMRTPGVLWRTPDLENASDLIADLMPQIKQFATKMHLFETVKGEFDRKDYEDFQLESEEVVLKKPCERRVGRKPAKPVEDQDSQSAFAFV